MCYIPKHSNAAPCSSGGSLTTCTQAGLWEYDSSNKIYQYCNGTNFISMSSGTVTATCAGITEGTLEYNTTLNNFEYCDGTNWIQFANSALGAICSDTGQIEFNTADSIIEVCNGTNKISVIGVLIGNTGSLTTPPLTAWANLSASPGFYNQTEDIIITNSGTCDQNITSVSVSPLNDCGIIMDGSGTPTPFCPLSSVNGFSLLETDCIGTLLPSATCTISVTGGANVTTGTITTVNGTLTINTSTLTQTDNLRFTAGNADIVIIPPL